MLRNLFFLRRTSRAPTCQHLRVSLPLLPYTRHNHSTSETDNPTKHYTQHLIRTLNPAFVTQADYVHFPTDQDHCSIWDAYASSSPVSTASNDPSHRRPFTIVRAGKGRPFPGGLGGYFYYYLPLGPVPPTAGEIRFRCVPGVSPEFFNQGHDFVADPDRGLPWHLPLTTIAAWDSHQVLRNILLADRLVTGDILARAADMNKHLVKARMGGTGAKVPVIHSFGQPWYIDFDSQVHWWHFMSVDRVHILPPMPNIFSWKIGKDRTPSPWLGAALCAFKPDYHPSLRGRRIVRAQVLKLLRPVAQNPEFPPELRYLVEAPEAAPREGHFLQHGRTFWQFSIDGENVGRARREGFGALFANTGLPSLRTERALRPRPPGVKEFERAGMRSRREDGDNEQWKRTLQSRVQK